jgi:two-component system chemotaxis response regulator CheB
VPRRDIVVVGGSAGATEALKILLRGLPRRFPAALFVVVHVGPGSRLAEVLDPASPLPVVAAENGMPIEKGRAVVAGPGRHMLLHDQHVLLSRGPTENRARPAVDALFRSAACTFGSRVIGVLLSGDLNDGTAGLLAIRRCGGTAVVQAPRDSIVPGMPLSAIRHGADGRIVRVAEMADLLTCLVQEEAGPTPDIPFSIRFEATIAAQGSAQTDMGSLAELSPYICPTCHGPLWEITEGNFTRYRCHAGHAMTADILAETQATDAERTLSHLFRAQQQRAMFLRHMADRERQLGNAALAETLLSRAAGCDEDAATLQRMMPGLDDDASEGAIPDG